jgi:hypothetical protein
MSGLVNHLETIFFHPFSGIQKEIKEILRHTKFVSDSNSKRVEGIMATLNGEDQWMIRRIKGDCDDKF